MPANTANRARLADVFVQQRNARVDRPLTYAIPPGFEVGIGDVLRVPLGTRDVYGYAIGVRDGLLAAGVREIAERVDGPRAFDDEGLALARWMAARYCTSLGEALSTVAFAPALPRVVDRFVVAGTLDPAEHPKLPPRLLRLIASDFSDGFTLQALLRHPEARRAGDRATLLRAIATLQRAGVLRRERSFERAAVRAKTERRLEAAGAPITGHRARALVEHVAAYGPLRRSDALLAGFSNALITRAVREGALRETHDVVIPSGASRDAQSRGQGHLEPNAAQHDAIERVVSSTRTGAFGELLLQGVTGSGKTLVYLRAIAEVVRAGGRAIVLVPEISLTPQTTRRFEEAFGERVAVLHSALSERERFENWSAAGRGEVDVVVGARSAVFAPLPNVRLIVVDEAHERTYKQDSSPRYDAVAVARRRMLQDGGTLVLGSATPPLEAYETARRGTIAHLRLGTRASELPLPQTHLVDLGGEFAAGNRKIFSTRLVEALGERLERGEKSVLFVNRRGSARFLLCRACGAVPHCARCDLSLVAHRAEGLLRCHLCDAQHPLPERCPTCGDGPIREFGVGTQTVSDAVTALFPRARLVRMDGDTTTRVGDHARLLDDFETRADVLVGTQMVAKGLDFPDVTLAAVIAADAGLHAPDFRAAERTFDLITQVAGRSGRAKPGEAIVQTYAPNHPAVALAARHDFDAFAEQELAARRDLGYPPFSELIYLGIVGRDHGAVREAAERYTELLRRAGSAEVLGPAPYSVARAADEWRYRIALKAPDLGPMRRFVRETLRALAERERSTRLVVNVDP